jgi:hypothetical protein
MGGWGSTRWGRHNKKTTVEECRQLDVSRWVREGIVTWDTWRQGSWCWTYGDGSTSTISYEVDTRDPARPWARLHYDFPMVEGRPSYDYRVELQTTRPHFGGHRWWFTCALSANGVYCGRRVRKLYLPPGERYFGCRHCYDLTYTSCQESDKRVNALRKLDSLTLLDMAKSGEIGLTLALRVIRQ